MWAGASVSPDSNLNSATDASRVNLFGLPFELDDNARRQSGVALSVFGGLERAFRLRGGNAARVSVVASASDAPGIQFDTASFSVRAGPEWRIPEGGEAAVQLTGSQRWYGGAALDDRVGLFAMVEAGGAKTRWMTAVSADSIDDQLSDGRDGWSGGVDLARTVYLSPSSLWRAALSVTLRRARSESNGYTQARASTGVLLRTPFSSMTYVEPYIMSRRYNAAAVAFGDVREDTEFGVTARLSKRDWTIAGAFPFVSLSVSRSQSTVAIGDFTRERVEFGFTREY